MKKNYIIQTVNDHRNMISFDSFKSMYNYCRRYDFNALQYLSTKIGTTFGTLYDIADMDGNRGRNVVVTVAECASYETAKEPSIDRDNLINIKGKGMQYCYVIDSINIEDKEIGTAKERIDYFFERFEVEYNNDYTKRLYPQLSVRITEYIKGLPSCINIAFSDYDISELGKKWGLISNEKQQAVFINNWFSLIAVRLIELKQLYNK